MPREIQTVPAKCCVCGWTEAQSVACGIDFEYETCSNSFEYVRCKGCGHHYLSPCPAAEELATIYPDNYANYSSSVKPSLAFQAKGWIEGRTLSRLSKRFKGQIAVLDVGCGDGRLLDGVRKYCPNATQLDGIEISAKAASVARSKGYTVHIGSFEHLELLESAYDLVFVIQVVEHFFHPLPAVKKVHAVLRPGGTVLFETPSVDCVDFQLFKKRYWGGYHFPRHINLFRPSQFTELLEREGFEIISVSQKLQPVHWIWSFHHLLKEAGFPAWLVNRFHIKNLLLLAVFSAVEVLQVSLLRHSSNMQVIAKKHSAQG